MLTHCLQGVPWSGQICLLDFINALSYRELRMPESVSSLPS
jgi:hypothetical protein